MNNALRHQAIGYDYFAVIDADEVIPADFMEKLLPYFSLDRSIAFVASSGLRLAGSVVSCDPARTICCSALPLVTGLSSSMLFGQGLPTMISSWESPC